MILVSIAISKLQLQSWRANFDWQLLIDHYACDKHLAKYSAKGENEE